MKSADQRTAAERFLLALDLHEAGVALMRQNLRRQYLEADEIEIDARLNQWLRERPGAEFGDSAGRPVDCAARFPEVSEHESS